MDGDLSLGFGKEAEVAKGIARSINARPLEAERPVRPKFRPWVDAFSR